MTRSYKNHVKRTISHPYGSRARFVWPIACLGFSGSTYPSKLHLRYADLSNKNWSLCASLNSAALLIGVCCDLVWRAVPNSLRSGHLLGYDRVRFVYKNTSALRGGTSLLAVVGQQWCISCQTHVLTMCWLYSRRLRSPIITRDPSIAQTKVIGTDICTRRHCARPFFLEYASFCFGFWRYRWTSCPCSFPYFPSRLIRRRPSPDLWL